MDENNVQNVAEQDTTPETPETQQELDAEVTPETQSQDGESYDNNSVQGADNVPDTPFLEIKYNHETKGLSRDEAQAFAQKGMKYEGAYKVLERFATLKGVSVDEFVNGLESAEDEAYKDSLIEKYGGDEETINQMMELYNLKKQQTLDNASKNIAAERQAEEQSTNTRIAEEFSKMKADFPELTEFSALPDEVKKAAYNGLSLEHAYLKHKISENKKIEAAKQAEKKADNLSSGKIEAQSDSEIQAEKSFLDALWGR